jgi:amino-acid N-acetyltransferase
MHVFRRPAGAEVLRLLGEAGLPTADLTPPHLEHFFGCGPEHAPAGVVGLEIHGPGALLRSLVVAESARGQGCGKALVAEAERHARDCGVERVYLLTTTAAKFFGRLGYVALARDEAPETTGRATKTLSEESSCTPT